MCLISGIVRLFKWYRNEQELKCTYFAQPSIPLLILRYVLGLSSFGSLLLPFDLEVDSILFHLFVRFVQFLLAVRELIQFCDIILPAPESEEEIQRFYAYIWNNSKWRTFWALLGLLYSPRFSSYGYVFPLVSLASMGLDHVIAIRQEDEFRVQIKKMGEKKAVEKQMKTILPREYDMSLPSSKRVYWYSNRITVLERAVIELHTEVEKHRSLTYEGKIRISMDNVD